MTPFFVGIIGLSIGLAAGMALGRNLTHDRIEDAANSISKKLEMRGQDFFVNRRPDYEKLCADAVETWNARSRDRADAAAANPVDEPARPKLWPDDSQAGATFGPSSSASVTRSPQKESND